MQIFTWHNVENELLQCREQWPKSWNRVDVYFDGVFINVNPEENDPEENKTFLKDLFKKNYSENGVLIEFSRETLPVYYEDGDPDEKFVPVKVPLFKEYAKNIDTNESELAVPMIAFHSYKGGVGRTLSLIAMAEEIAALYADKKKILVIDADIEAPGLTWMLSKETAGAKISYLDVLELMNFNTMNESLADAIAKLIRKCDFMIETENFRVREYFLPVYRVESQMMNLFSTPEKIIAMQENKFIFTEFIAKVGAALGVDVILVDLRAGITEFSAPYLFDPRVQKYFVSSTSMQSVKGISSVLRQIAEKTPKVLRNTKVLLTMIPNEMEVTTIQRKEDELVADIENELDNAEGADGVTLLRENYIVRIPFEQPFIYLNDFQEICRLLKGKILTQKMRKLAEELFAEEEERELSEEKVKEVLKNLNQLASEEITAEGNSSATMLTTGAIREIAKNFSDTIPKAVIMGAKGSGKTYLYKQMIATETWGQFLRMADNQSGETMDEVLIVPFICSVNYANFIPHINKCLQNVKTELDYSGLRMDAVDKNYRYMEEKCQKELSITEWTGVWRERMLGMLGDNFETFEQADEYLGQKGKKVVFLIDGLEDLFMNLQPQKDESWKAAIRAICQNIVNELRNLPEGNIGIIVFVRKDMAAEAISVNFEQFKNQYARYELKWNSTEALRLALWIAMQVKPFIYDEKIDILRASREVIESHLELLWGKKLGKNDSREANSARWIIAALSDFTKQLQARDIVRFLKFATDNWANPNIYYTDRYIMPADIKRAIPNCSQEKYKEIESEMKSIYQILRKFQKMDESEKQLPLTLNKLNLTGEEIARLEEQGYLVASDKRYYMPEIIRFALGFKYEKGARPKVLSLLAG